MGSALIFLCLQVALLSAFCFFAFFKYLYAAASLRPIEFLRTPPSGRRCAVVIVAYNEAHVVEDTIAACDQLTYAQKLIVLADDSSDPDIVVQRQEFACARGCIRVRDHEFQERVETAPGVWTSVPVEIWESPEFVLFQRPINAGFKAGSLRQVHAYLERRGVDVIYLLDADWHPQPDTLERVFEILEADNRIAFVQTKRVAREQGMNLFQKLVSIMEETCYFVDFQGRQALRHPILFSGCCALLRLDAIRSVGGFQSGHLTEDLDLSNRLWLNGWNGVYAGHITNSGEVPFAYDHFRRQQERWAAGTSACLRKYFWPIISCNRLSAIHRIAILRQNAYFFGNVFTIIAFAVAAGNVSWILAKWDNYDVEIYLYIIGKWHTLILSTLFVCIFAVFIGPLMMICVHKKSYRDLFYLPMSIWYAWSIPYTYLAGNMRGIFGTYLEWFRTPKMKRRPEARLERTPMSIRCLYGTTLVVFLLFYSTEGWAFGWIDLFALIWIPSMLIASME